MYERALETREPSCVPKADKPFFIPVVHSPQGAWDTCQHRSSPQQGGEVRGHGTRGGTGAHLCKEVWSEATAYVVARGCMPYFLS
jgi:hypothetical protein